MNELEKLYIEQVLPTYGPSAGGVGTVVKNIYEISSRDPNVEVRISDLGSLAKFSASGLRSNSGSLPVSLPRLFCNIVQSRNDIVHIHGAWHPLSLASAGARFVGKHKLVCSPHGMLTPWILSKNSLKKKIALIGWERLHWQAVDCFHALTSAEAAEISEIVPKGKRIAIIPNGISIDQRGADPGGSENRKPYIIYLGRFHEKKGIDLLLKAWEQVSPLIGDVTLKLVGWGDMEELKNLPSKVELLPPVFDDKKKKDLVANALFLILPSLSEGLPMVILEAWAEATPVIMTEGCNLGIGFEANAAIKIEPSIDSIAKGLLSAVRLDENERLAMGLKGRELCVREFSIEMMWLKMKALYQWLSQDCSSASPSDIKILTT